MLLEELPTQPVSGWKKKSPLYGLTAGSDPPIDDQLAPASVVRNTDEPVSVMPPIVPVLLSRNCSPSMPPMPGVLAVRSTQLVDDVAGVPRMKVLVPPETYQLLPTLCTPYSGVVLGTEAGSVCATQFAPPSDV